MSPACLHKYIFLVLFLICGCVAADVHVENQTSNDQVPYVSRLNEPQSNAYFYYSRGRMLLAEDNFEGAAADFLKAVDFDPDDETLRFELAELYLAMNQPEKTVRTVEDILLRNPDSVRANLTLKRFHTSVVSLSLILKKNRSVCIWL
jgi:tetratricopeptide (TPR) repeat protein